MQGRHWRHFAGAAFFTMFPENSMPQSSTIPAPMLPRFLVLLATYNGARWLVEQIESILAQQDVHVDIHITDDNSIDQTRSLIEATWGRDARVRLMPQGPGTGSAGANFRRMLRSADMDGYDYIALADQDDIWMPLKLATAVAQMRRHGADGYSCAVSSFWPDGRERVLGQVARTTGCDFLFEGAGQGCTFVLTHSLGERVQRFCLEFPAATEAMHYHDWLIYTLVRAWDLSWYFDPQAWLRYRQHDGNEIGSRGGLKSITKRLELIKGGWFKRQILAALTVFRLANNANLLVNHFDALFQRPATALRRLRLSIFFIRDGRRRLADRAVMVFAALAGWT
jgi:rhamnosyltransferase